MIDELTSPHFAKRRPVANGTRDAIRQAARRSVAVSPFDERPKHASPDPRLAVLDALSSALDNSPKRIDGKLIDAARQLGWTLADLKLLFPSVAWHRQMAFRSGSAAEN